MTQLANGLRPYLGIDPGDDAHLYVAVISWLVLRPSPVVLRPSPVVLRPSPVVLRPSPVVLWLAT
jgi:hypothetical protein